MSLFAVRRVPVLHHVQALVDLPAQLLLGEVVADEHCPDHAAEFLDRLVGRVLGTAAGEAAQHLVGLGGLEPQRGRVLDHLVVLAGDQVPVETREVASDAAFS
jgi:hypothetical protein